MALAYSPRGPHDAILGFTEHLAEALAWASGAATPVLLRRRTGAWTTAPGENAIPLHAALIAAGTDALALQYNPFSYGHWGVAPGLLAELLAARRRGVLDRLILVVHEPFVVEPGLRYTMMSWVQRAQLAALLELADTVLATCDAWLAPLAALRPSTRVSVVPAGSNLPDQRYRRASMRALLAASPETLVVAAFGLNHPHQLIAHVAEALRALLDDGHEVIFISLGRSSDVLSLTHPRLRLLRPGPQDAPDVASMLASADLFLAPYADGASTRRTTLMAALQHGLCIVTTDIEGGDGVLRDESLVQAHVTDFTSFASLCRDVARDRATRERLGAAARTLYDREFSWRCVAERFLAAISPDASSLPAALPIGPS